MVRKAQLVVLGIPLASPSSDSGPTTSSSHAVHHLYLKRHATRRTSEGEEALPTLFVANVPWGIADDAVVRTLRAHFSATCGPVRSVECHELESVRMRCAHVVFEAAAALAAALRAPFALATATWARDDDGDGEVPTSGLAAQLAAHAAARPSAATLRKRVNVRISEFEAKEEAAEVEKKRRREMMDADGFTLVSRKHQVTQATMERKANAKGKKRKGELKNFYAFQMRAEKKGRLTLLRARFEEDKKRIAKMIAARSFRPDK